MASCMISTDDHSCLWAEAIKMASYLKNIAPHSADPLKRTPFERFFGNKPSIKNLRPFGIRGFVHNPKEARKPGTKLLHRAELGILVGYGRDTNTFRMYIPSRHVVQVSKDVAFSSFEDSMKHYETKIQLSMETTEPKDAPQTTSTQPASHLSPLGDRPVTLPKIKTDLPGPGDNFDQRDYTRPSVTTVSSSQPSSASPQTLPDLSRQFGIG